MYKLLLLCLILPSTLYSQTYLTLMTTKSNSGYGVSYEVSTNLTNYYSLGGSVINQYDLLGFNVINSVLLYSGFFDVCTDVEVGILNENAKNNRVTSNIGVGFVSSLGGVSCMIEPRLIYDACLKWDVLFGLYYKSLILELNTDANSYELTFGILIKIG